jgi:hypothetical protein
MHLLLKPVGQPVASSCKFIVTLSQSASNLRQLYTHIDVTQHFFSESLKVAPQIA